MIIRKAENKDIQSIMHIIHQAQYYMKTHNIDQWQNGYPDENAIDHDIREENSYVFLDGEVITATFCLSFDGEETYGAIYEGEWLSMNRYAVIHRVAVEEHQKGKGIASQMIAFAEKCCTERDISSIKIDTHPDNQSMQTMLRKNGFQYCGIIYLKDGSKRIAFEKILK